MVWSLRIGGARLGTGLMPGRCWLISRIYRGPISWRALLLEVAGPWGGFAAAFHLYHNPWEGQRVLIGLIGWAVSFAVMGNKTNAIGAIHAPVGRSKTEPPPTP